MDPFFIYHVSIYSLIVLLEMSFVIKLVKLGSKKNSNSTREIINLILVNLCLAIVGLLPLSYGIDLNF